MPEDKYTVAEEDSVKNLSWPRRFLKSLFGDNDVVSCLFPSKVDCLESLKFSVMVFR